MAGLGEACSHVAAVMFYVECAVRIRNSKTVADEKAYWMLPPALEVYRTTPSVIWTLNHPVQRKESQTKNRVYWKRRLSSKRLTCCTQGG